MHGWRRSAHDLLPGGIAGGVSGLLFAGDDLVVAERNAPGRVFVFRHARRGSPAGFQPGFELIRTNNSVGLALDSRRDLLVIEKSEVVLFRHPKFN